VAGFARLHRRNANLDFRAARRLFERQFEVVAEIGAAEHAVAAATASLLAEYFAEDVAECISETAESLGAARTGRAEPRGRVDAGVTELIVRGPLPRVGQDFVRFLRFLEFLFGVLVVRAAVRMMLHRELPVRLLDVLFGGVAIQAQHRVVVAFRHISSAAPSATAR
jgi:hypothetical protein